MIPPFSLPMPLGSTERERQQLLHDWLAAEVQLRQYSSTVGGLVIPADGDELAERKRRANGLLVEGFGRLADCRRLIDDRIDELRRRGEWKDGWPQSAEGIVRYTIDVMGDDPGMGLWPFVIGAVLVLLALGGSIALLAIPLEDLHKIIEQLPSFEDVVEAAGKATGLLLAIAAVGGGLYMLWSLNQ